jgi:hypothetical protein
MGRIVTPVRVANLLHPECEILIEGFDRVVGEVVFMDMPAVNGGYEPLLGYVTLEQSQAAVDLVGHRLIKVRHLDLK